MIVKNAEIKDIFLFHKLVSRLFNDKYNWSDSWYKWQCFDNPFVINLKLAIENDNLLGVFGLQQRLLLPDIHCGQISWINVNPDYKNIGIFTELSKHVLKDSEKLDLLFIFANNNALIPCQQKLGLKIIGKLNRLTLELTQINKNYFKNVAYKCKKISSNTDLKSFFKFEDLYMFDHSSSFRHWRFANPDSQYYKVSIPTGEYLIFKIYRSMKNKDSFGDLVDFECNLKDIDSYKKLLFSAISELKFNNVTYATIWANEQQQLYKAIKDIGFVESSNNTYFCIKVLKSKYSHLYNFKNWHLVQSDATNY